MKRHWSKLLVGLIAVLILAAAVFGRIYGYTLVLLIIIMVLVFLLGYGLLTYLYANVNWIIGEAIWPRGYFLKDDRHQSVSVDESVMKTKFKITKEQMKNLHPNLKIKDLLTAPPNLMVMGMVAIGAGAWLITSYSSVSVSRLINGVYTILLVVVGAICMRYMKLFFMKMNCRAVLFNQCCGACLFKLQGQIPESDGCVVCPECGGAWRLDRCPKCAKQLDSVDADSCPGCGWNRPVNGEAKSEPVR